jgi:hypothetical protein
MTYATVTNDTITLHSCQRHRNAGAFYINSASIGIVKSSQQSTITDGATGLDLIHLR